MCEIKPPLSNRPDGSYELVGLPVVSQMFSLPTGIFLLLWYVNTRLILLIN